MKVVAATAAVMGIRAARTGAIGLILALCSSIISSISLFFRLQALTSDRPVVMGRSFGSKGGRCALYRKRTESHRAGPNISGPL